MQDTTLVALSLTITALGIIGLQYVLLVVEPAYATILEIRSMTDGTPVLLEGELVNVAHRGELTLLTVEQPATIEAVLFTTVNVTPGGCVRIRGKKHTYTGPQVVASRVTLC